MQTPVKTTGFGVQIMSGGVASDIIRNNALKYNTTRTTDVFGAGSYIQTAFGVARDEANKILTYWMHTFSERHPA